MLDRDELRDFRRLKRDAGNSLFVFETQRGGPLSTDALQYIVREAGKLARLDVEVHPHMLRHAVGYYLINEGLHRAQLVRSCGHVVGGEPVEVGRQMAAHITETR